MSAFDLKKQLQSLSTASHHSKADSTILNKTYEHFYQPTVKPEDLYNRKDNAFLRPANMQPVGVKAAFRSNGQPKKPVLTTAEEQRWKEFNSYERRDHNLRKKEAVRGEINDIYYKIALERQKRIGEAAATLSNMDAASTASGWKVPDIEATARYFDENARYYNTHRDERRYGVKHVPPPKAENLQQLLEERLLYAQAPGVKNYLLNSRYVRQKSREHERALSSTGSRTSQLSRREDGNKRNARLASHLQNKKTIPSKLRESIFDKAAGTAPRSRTSEHVKDYASERGGAKSRVLKVGAGKYYFPKRQRFNENLDDEVESIKSHVSAAKESAQVRLARMVEGNKSRERTASEELSKYFSQKTSPEDLLSAVTASRRGGTAEGSDRMRLTRTRVAIDCGNRRYAASQVSSFAGGLLNG
jgi:hypothetical protein